jgi:hypothetical protein
MAADPVSIAQNILDTANDVLRTIRNEADISNNVANQTYNNAMLMHKISIQYGSSKYENQVKESELNRNTVNKNNTDKINAATLDVIAANKSLGLVIQSQIIAIESRIMSINTNTTLQLNLTESNHKHALAELISRHKCEIDTMLSEQRIQIADIKTHSSKILAEIEKNLNDLKTKLDKLNM